MGHIMHLIAELEKQAVEEARQVATQPQPDNQQQQDQQRQPKSMATAPHPIARVLAAQPLSIGSRRMAVAALTDPLAAGALRAAEASTIARQQTSSLTTHARAAQPTIASAPPCAQPPLSNCSSEQVPAQALAQAPQQLAQPPVPCNQLNAAAVASSVRAKIQQLQQQVVDKDGQLAALRQQVEAVQREHVVMLQAEKDCHKVGLGGGSCHGSTWRPYYSCKGSILL
jgi:hypothetical protein